VIIRLAAGWDVSLRWYPACAADVGNAVTIELSDLIGAFFSGRVVVTNVGEIGSTVH
jgi:hypothetical protein